MTTNEATFKAVLRAGLYIEHVKGPGVKPTLPRWEVADLNGNIHAVSDDMDATLDKGWSKFQKNMAKRI